MTRRSWHIGGGVFVAVLSVAITAVVHGAGKSSPSGVTVHEWGTFTSVAGQDGRPVEWAPLQGPQDLPCFVQQVSAPQIKSALNWVTFTPSASGQQDPVSWL